MRSRLWWTLAVAGPFKCIELRHMLDGISDHILLVIVCSIIPLSVPTGRGEARCRAAFFHFLC